MSICENDGLREVQAPVPGVSIVFPEGSSSSICENGGLRTVRAPLPCVPSVFLEGKAQDLCYLPLVLQGSSSSICGVFPEGSFSFICENDGLWDVQASLPGVSSVLFGGFVIFHWFYKVHLPPSVRMVD